MFGIQKSEWTRCWWILLLIAEANSIEWKHSAILDNNFLVLWTPGESDITFEVQVKTPGYVGFGFTKDDGSESVDMVIGWVDNNGQVHLQDRHIKGANRDPQMDSSQDYHLQSGYENKTHTVLRFNRRYDTCDPRDLKITNDTLKIVWQYHVDEPVSASGVLPVDGAVRGTRPLYLVQLRENRPQRRNSRNDDPDGQLQSWDVLNTGVRLPMDQDTLLQCRIFKAPKLPRKHHVIRYEPVIQPGSQDYLHHMTLFECRGSDEILLEQARIVNGSSCGLADRLHAQCSSPVATWSIGSEGFAFPSEAGLPLEAWPTPGAPKYYLLETHYSNPLLDAFVTDSSGLRLWHTERLRRHDAGLLSIGIEPNWRHIIPPGQSEVISEGHCISRCTESALPDHGVNVFSVVMHTHQLGKKVRLRQIRGSRELPPIVADGSYEPSYQESRNLQTPAKVLPGDHLIAECTYSSKKRQTITLGGLSDKEETCLVSVLYYPRQLDLSLCYSLPSLPTVLHSLGIDKLEGPSPLRIISPPELRGMTLEERLVSYDWRESYQSFLDATRKGTFKALCTDAKGLVLPDSNVEAHYPRVIWPYQDPKLPCTKKPQLQRNKLSMLLSEDDDIDGQQQQQQQQNNHNHYDNEYESNTVERGQLVRNKFSRSSEASLTAAASSRSIFCPGLLLAIAFSSLLMMTAVR